jgi:uncharacterized protein with HEPN domain
VTRAALAAAQSGGRTGFTSPPPEPWRRIVGARNILIHGYLGIDNDIIWDIVKNEVAPLLMSLEKLEAAGNRR